MLFSCSRAAGNLSLGGVVAATECFHLSSSAAIFEVGGVPYSLLEPVLERCTPDQLYRIEEYNHVSILFGWEEGSFLACVSKNSFVSVNLLQLKGRPPLGHCSGHVCFASGPLNKNIFSICLWCFKWAF